MTQDSPLEKAIWLALTSVHAPMALVNGLARRYPSDVAPFAAIREFSAEGFADLGGLVEAGEGVAVLAPQPLDLPDGWQVMREIVLEQMVCDVPVDIRPAPFVALGQDDVPDMLALTAATEPGPFRPGTIRMGRYFGIRSPDGRLAAMAGERLQLDGFCEISAVCTHPDFRGRGYARSLVGHVGALAQAAGKTPFLHVTPTNGAKVVYGKVGFRLRRAVQLAVITRQ